MGDEKNRDLSPGDFSEANSSSANLSSGEVASRKEAPPTWDSATCHRVLCRRWLRAFLEEQGVPRQNHSKSPEGGEAGGVEGMDGTEGSLPPEGCQVPGPPRRVFREQLYAIVWRRLLRYVQSPARSFRLPEGSEEIVTEACQEATIRFLSRLQQRWPDVDFPTFLHLRSYFFVTARNCVVDELRQRLREEQPPPKTPTPHSLEEELQRFLPPIPSEQRESLKVVVRQWLQERLSAQDRQLLMARFFEVPPRPYQEIATLLSEPEAGRSFTAGQLRVRKLRLVRELARLLAQEIN